MELVKRIIEIKKFDNLLFTKAHDPIEEGIEFTMKQDGFHVATVEEIHDNFVLAWSSNAGKGVHIEKYTFSEMKKRGVHLYRFPKEITQGEKENLRYIYNKQLEKKYDYWGAFQTLKRYLPNFMQKWFSDSEKRLFCSEYVAYCWQYVGLIKLTKKDHDYTPFEICNEFFKKIAEF